MDLSGLPDHAELVKALTRVVNGDPSWRWLEVGCSLAAGRGDELSDVDAAVGYELVSEELEAAGTSLVEAIGEPLDLLVHAEAGWPDGIVRFAVEYRSGVQLDLVFMPAGHRPGLPVGSVALVDKDGHLAEPWAPDVHHATAKQTREWTMLGWWALSNVAKYVRREARHEALEALRDARTHMLRVFAVSRGIPYPGFGLTSLLDYEPFDLPSALTGTYATPRDATSIVRAAFILADIHTATAAKAAERLDVGLSTPWEQVARGRLRNAATAPGTGTTAPGVIDVPLTLVGREPEHVVGPKAFVLFQPDVGHVEVGTPPPGHDIWEHQSGDLRYTSVQEIDGSRSGGGGGPWDGDRLDVLASIPGPGTVPWATGYVVAGLVQPEYVNVVLGNAGRRYQQTPINGTVVFPLPDRNDCRFTLHGIDSAGHATELYSREPMGFSPA